MARFLLESGPIPLHHQVYLDLRGAIDRGEWHAGDRMPTERDLTIRYGCSLITIRRALDELSREGRLERARGRGTFVTAPPIVRDIAARASFADEMRARGLDPYAEVLAAAEEPAPPAVAEELGIAPGAPVWYLERVRGADGVPLLLEQAHLSAVVFPGLLDEDFTRESLYDVLERRYGRRVVRTRETISAVVPRRREAPVGSPDRKAGAVPGGRRVRRGRRRRRAQQDDRVGRACPVLHRDERHAGAVRGAGGPAIGPKVGALAQEGPGRSSPVGRVRARRRNR